ESHADVRDRANDSVRVDARDVRARVIGEGGNLGCTQRGRIEYALAGGRINTDFIDNSAGVNTSDVEVNLKILLNAEERAGRLRRAARDRLLVRISDDVAAQVLRNNYLQSQAISMIEAQSGQRLSELQHLIRSLERAGELDRALEFLPDDETLAERRRQGFGMTRPELAVLLAYSKIALNRQLLDSDVPEDPYLGNELARYFPPLVRRRFGSAIARHRLRREIIATATTNSLVNRMGPSFVVRAHEDTGATPAAIARAYTIAREVFAMRDIWQAIEKEDNRLPAAVQYQMMYDCSRLLRHSTYWLLRNRRRQLDIDTSVREFRPYAARLARDIARCLAGADLQRHAARAERLQKSGVPAPLRGFLAGIEALDATWDLAELAAQHRVDIRTTAQLWFAGGARLGLDWLRAEIEQLSVDGQWQAVARAGLREAGARLQRQLVERLLRHRSRGSVAARIDAWLGSLGEPLANWQRTLHEMRAAGGGDFATLSVGIDALRKLVD
ncbi:MAG: NAD-glutamate dehydrogenase, partial [Steroidobacteraceae bacterium]|nr:NAD-glutamate dehydrogenase [Steroidobacteraceae bacterium]